LAAATGSTAGSSSAMGAASSAGRAVSSHSVATRASALLTTTSSSHILASSAVSLGADVGTSCAPRRHSPSRATMFSGTDCTTSEPNPRTFPRSSKGRSLTRHQALASSGDSVVASL